MICYKSISAEVLKRIEDCFQPCPRYPSYIGKEHKPRKRFAIGYCNNFIKSTKARIKHSSKHLSAWYDWKTDEFSYESFIAMPKQTLFKGIRNQLNREQVYYIVLFHELIHWTGSHERLGRKSLILGFDNSFQYKLEEVTAELGSIFICLYFGVYDSVPDLSCQYIRKHLEYENKNIDKNIHKLATKQAIEAFQYLLNLYNSN